MSTPVTAIAGAVLASLTLQVLRVAGVPMTYPLAISIGLVVGCILARANIEAEERRP